MNNKMTDKLVNPRLWFHVVPSATKIRISLFTTVYHNYWLYCLQLFKD